MSTKPLQVRIPDDLPFSALKLARDADGTVSLDWTPIRRICAENGIDPEIFSDAPEDNVSALLVAWYSTHRARGGEPDPVADDLLAEVLAEDALGAGISHAPGRA